MFGLTFIVQSQEVAKDESISIFNEVPDDGFVYEYFVNFQGSKYNFYVSNILLDMDDFTTFHYRMDNYDQTEGDINISKDATASATDLYNYFSGGEVTLDNQTSVWLSRKIFEEIKDKGKVVISTDKSSPKTFKVIKAKNDADKYYKVLVDGEYEYIPCIQIATEDGSQEIWITDNPNNPLILKMFIGFSIELFFVNTF
ncbi:MAG: hypothetical protein LC105_06975 [Chitinophagales bacterium]|nr:hypothetical protein [Chitinophagales bacterium]MCZ2393578.1 hypothetical protein [Chitinophagales bacterium]